MRRANFVVWLASFTLFGSAVLAQPSVAPQFGDRIASISIHTWVFIIAILAAGALGRIAWDLRRGAFAWSASYFVPTVVLCFFAGFIACSLCEYYISKGNSLHPFVQMGVMFIASINFSSLFDLLRRWAYKRAGIEDKHEAT